MLHIVPHSLPPQVSQGAHPSELLAHLVHSRLFGRQPMRFDSHFKRGDLSLQLVFNLV